MDNQYCTFYIVRHGETDWNVNGLLQGHMDIPLNQKGENQARELAMKFKNVNFHAVYSSDLMRTKRTAELILFEKKIAIKTTQLLRERSYGKFEGLNWEGNNEFRQYVENMRSLPKEERISKKWEVETDESVVSRFITFLREAAVFNPGKKILIVTHGGIMRISLIHLGFGTLKTFPARSISNTAYVKLESDGVDFFVKEKEGIEIADK